MRKFLALAALLLAPALAHADTTTARLSLVLPTAGSYNWQQKFYNDMFAIDSGTFLINASNDVTAGSTTIHANSPWLIQSSSFQFTGANGYIISASSIQGSGFFGSTLYLTGSDAILGSETVASSITALGTGGVKGTTVTATQYLLVGSTVPSNPSLGIISTNTATVLGAMTTTEKNLLSVAEGGLVYDRTLHRYSYWNAQDNAWVSFSTSSSSGGGMSDGGNAAAGLTFLAGSTATFLSGSYSNLCLHGGRRISSGTLNQTFDVQTALISGTTQQGYVWVVTQTTDTTNTDWLQFYFSTGQARINPWSPGAQSNAFYQFGGKTTDNTGGVAGSGSNAGKCATVTPGGVGFKQGRPLTTKFSFQTDVTSTTYNYQWHTIFDCSDGSVGACWNDGGGHAGPFSVPMSFIGFGITTSADCTSASPTTTNELQPMNQGWWEYCAEDPR